MNNLNLKSYITQSGHELLYNGSPDFDILESLCDGPGDLWHSSLDQGFENCFGDLVYQSAVFWWLLNDIKNNTSAVNWRVNAKAFVIRKRVWETLGGFDQNYSNSLMSGLDFGFNLIRNSGGIPLYVKNLYAPNPGEIEISIEDRYEFFVKNFKKSHSYYMICRKGFKNIFKEFEAYRKATTKHVHKPNYNSIKIRNLKPIIGNPSVSLIIPTMRRQESTERLLLDYNSQTYPIKEAIIVDATPEIDRDSKYYNQKHFKFDLILKWQETKGSCRARNEAIKISSGDYIIFADDDVRVLPDFVENHIKLLQTYNAKACNGLDIMANHEKEDLADLNKRLKELGENRWVVGVPSMFSNANSCVKRELVNTLIGNDVNFDGGYGEDSDFGHRILNHGEVLLYNPFSPNLHLKPKSGGYRWWHHQSKIKGKTRKKQPWELGKPVKYITPIPSPTITYGVLKHFNKKQVKEWRLKYYMLYLFKGKKRTLLFRFLNLPYKHLQFNKSLYYAKNLINEGEKFI